MRRAAWPLVLGLLMVLVPAAGAVYAPQLYFLAPPTDDPLEGELATEQPTGNVSTSTLVTALPADAPSASFIALSGPNATHVLGRVLVGLWTDVSAASGSVEARFVLVDASGTATAVSQAAQSVSTDPEKVPAPESLLPPDPSDPEGAVFHLALQAMPLLQHPPTLLDLGVVDVAIPEGSVAGVELRLVDDNTSATVAPASGFARVNYGAAATPSFVYVPWWDDSEPASGGSGSPTPSPTPQPGTSPSDPGSGDLPTEQELPDDAESPGSPLALLVMGLVALTVLRRRR